MARLFYFFMALVPKNLLSFLTGKLVDVQLPGSLGPWSVKTFANFYNINTSEAELPLEHYKTINQLFTRRLKPGARPVGEGILHPADSEISMAGAIDSSTLIQAKGRFYNLYDFVGDQTKAKKFEGGSFVTYYLCPTDYHRVHSPIDGHIEACSHIPGQLWPVNPWSVSQVKELFAVNERVVIWLVDQNQNPVILVMVGATNVGKMTMSFDASIVTNASHRRKKVTALYSPSIATHRGSELGTFNMGSTVVMILPPGHEPLPRDLVGKKVRMGESLLAHRLQS